MIRGLSASVLRFSAFGVVVLVAFGLGRVAGRVTSDSLMIGGTLVLVGVSGLAGFGMLVLADRLDDVGNGNPGTTALGAYAAVVVGGMMSPLVVYYA